MIGTKLAHYEITSHLGTGGMGEVYQATDSKLGRSVAIKLLPEAFTHDAERASRFEREARVLASLNHPNIATIHGVEESGGRKFLVMELVPGETLAEKTKRGAIPLDETLGIAKQITDALEAAHEKGVIHRDLKPANIKVTPEGKVKVLDFGLAKAFAGETVSASLSNSPTISRMATQQGLILGTAAYMSPEQAKGRDVDRRTDIFAFGAVLYEMLSGHQAFGGEDATDILSHVLRSEPDWTRVPPTAPEGIRRLLRRCLQKERRLRIHDIADARIEIDDANAEPFATDPVAPSRPGRKERTMWISLIVLLLAASVGMLLLGRKQPSVTAPEMRLDIAASPGTFALSPDGRNIVFASDDEGHRRKLWIRPLDSVVSRPLTGTEDANDPFWSPDSRTVGFIGNGGLKSIDVESGAVTILGNTPVFNGATMNRDGVVLVGTNTTGPVLRFSPSGDAMPVTPVVAQQSHSSPEFLPDGRHFLYHVRGGQEAGGVYLAQIGVSETRRLLDADSGAVYGAGQLFFVRQGTLFAQDFDLSKWLPSGTPSVVAQPVNGRIAGFSISEEGIIVYRTTPPRQPNRFIWFDRTGKTIGEPVADAVTNNGSALSSDGRSLAQPRLDREIWILDLTTNALSRFTFDPAQDSFPLWSPDGNRIVFSSNRKGTFDLYLKPASGAGAEEPLLVSNQSKVATDWSADGRFLLYRTIDPKTSYDVWALPLDGDKKPFPIVQTESEDLDAQFSPDARFIAYPSNESGRYEIYVQRFQAPGKWQISTEGGVQVRWRRDGKELFYLSLDGRLMSVPIGSNLETFSAGASVPLFMTRLGAGLQSTNRQQYMVSADGMRFLINTMNTESAGPPAPLTIVLNWKSKSSVGARVPVPAER